MMRMTAAALLLAAASPAAATEVHVRVLNVADAAGSVRVEICLPPEWLKDGCRLRASAPARAGIVTVTVPNVPPGAYAVVAHHDSDDDTEVGRNVLGIPTEGVGFSRGPSILFGAPKFEESAIQVTGDRTTIDIKLLFE